MADYIEQLYNTYCENNDDMFASDVDEALKTNQGQIIHALSEDLVDKFFEIQKADSERAFHRGFSIAMKLTMQAIKEVSV